MYCFLILPTDLVLKTIQKNYEFQKNLMFIIKKQSKNDFFHTKEADACLLHRCSVVF